MENLIKNQYQSIFKAACFICGMGKDFFDKVPHGFEIHTMREHNFANYMFFLMHLINKPETEYTGQVAIKYFRNIQKISYF